MRLIARYAKDRGSDFEIVTVYEHDTHKEVVPKTDPAIKTLAKEHPSAIWFERKMSDDFGIIIKDAFDKRPLVHQERFPHTVYPMLKDFKEDVLEFAEYKQKKVIHEKDTCIGISCFFIIFIYTGG